MILLLRELQVISVLAKWKESERERKRERKRERERERERERFWARCQTNVSEITN
jgi:hypothetical protein